MTSPVNLTVVHVSTETGWRGGEQQVRLLTEGLAARGVRCVVVSPPDAELFQDRMSNAGESLRVVPLTYRSEFDIFAAKRLAQTANEAGARIIHAHTSHAHSLAWLAHRWTSARIVVSRRVDFPISSNLFSRRKYQSPAIHYIAISKAIATILADGGIDPSRISIVHSGIDLARFPFRGEDRNESEAVKWGASPGVPLIANVAALTDHKDQTTLLYAAAELRKTIPEFKLIIAGNGELEQELKQLCTRLQLDHQVEFAGYVQDVKSLLHAADLFVMSSHLEGLCTSILDAMSAGVPVVATRTGGIPEIVEHEKNGLLASPRNPQHLATMMATLLSQPDKCKEFVQAGRDTVTSRFTNDSMAEGTLAVYRKLLKQR